MKICGISDIHGDLNINIPECDVLCICGDVINLNDQRDIPASKKWWETRFVKWVESLPCSKVIVIPGNHDFFLERMYTECWGWFKDRMRRLSNKKLEFLIDESFYYEDIHFYGTPWIEPIEFQEGKWAFEHPEGDKYYIQIPICDVLITHDNPYKNNKLNVCCWWKSEYHLFGHLHDGEDDSLRGKFNCSILDDMYNRKKKFKCVIIDIMTEKEAIAKVIKKLEESSLFICPQSNDIANHNKKIIDLLKNDGYLTEEEFLESSIITDFSV